jgi:hypothetical protein
MGGMTNDELKAALMKDMEAEIDELVKAHGPSERLTLTEIEDVVLAARQRMGQKLAERMIDMQEQARGAEIPISPVTGKRMHPKGKKTKRSSPG